MYTIDDLNAELQLLKRNGSDLLTVSDTIDSLTGLLAAFDSEFDQDIYDQGKALPNVEARKIAKDRMRNDNDKYQEASTQLKELKAEKARLFNERDCSKQLLEVGKLAIRQECVRQELEYLDGWIRLKASGN